MKTQAIPPVTCFAIEYLTSYLVSFQLSDFLRRFDLKTSLPSSNYQHLIKIFTTKKILWLDRYPNLDLSIADQVYYPVTRPCNHSCNWLTCLTGNWEIRDRIPGNPNDFSLVNFIIWCLHLHRASDPIPDNLLMQYLKTFRVLKLHSTLKPVPSVLEISKKWSQIF
jgi:hypothetical protein